jgi:Asp-tRNA(Asn)/Glu-tRNA(Gln) amidotransferase A subunit family amidase
MQLCHHRLVQADGQQGRREVAQINFEQLGLEALASRIQDGSVSVEAYVAHCAEACRQAAGLGAFTQLDAQGALEQARAIDLKRQQGFTLPPLAGLPYAAKDNIDTVGFATTGGTGILRDLQPAANAGIIDVLANHGAILLGKTNMHEMAVGGTTTNPTYGATRNPYAPDCVPGGSSGGSGAAVGARLVPFALGTDTAASVRLPASYCGVAGFRPTALSRAEKVYPNDGVVPCAYEFDTVGPIAKTVADLDFLDRVIRQRPAMAAPDPGRLRLGVPEHYFFDDLETPVADVMERALQLLRNAGVTLVSIPSNDYVGPSTDGFLILLGEAVCRDWPEYFDPALGRPPVDALLRDLKAMDVIALVEQLRAAPPSAADIERAKSLERRQARQVYLETLNKYQIDAVIFPTAPLLPPLIAVEGDSAHRSVVINGKDMLLVTTLIRNTMVGSFLGIPGVSLPAGLSPSGLPVGVELDGRSGKDAELLAAARTVEDILGRIAPPQPFAVKTA